MLKMNCGYKIIVGDAIGADLQIQKLLLENGYENVIVYYSGERARINLGVWQTKYIKAIESLLEHIEYKNI